MDTRLYPDFVLLRDVFYLLLWNIERTGRTGHDSVPSPLSLNSVETVDNMAVIELTVSYVTYGFKYMWQYFLHLSNTLVCALFQSQFGRIKGRRCSKTPDMFLNQNLCAVKATQCTDVSGIMCSCRVCLTVWSPEVTVVVVKLKLLFLRWDTVSAENCRVQVFLISNYKGNFQMMINIMSHSKKVLGLTPGHDPSVWSRWHRRGVQLTDDWNWSVCLYVLQTDCWPVQGLHYGSNHPLILHWRSLRRQMNGWKLSNAFTWIWKVRFFP